MYTSQLIQLFVGSIALAVVLVRGESDKATKTKLALNSKSLQTFFSLVLLVFVLNMPIFKKRKDQNSSLDGSFNDSINSLQHGHRFANETTLSILTKKEGRSALKRHWKAQREAKVVQKSAARVDKYVSELTEGLPFLQNAPNQPIAKFHRSEIIVGNQLGRGVFARVYDIRDFDLQDEEEEEQGIETRLHLIQEFEDEPELQSSPFATAGDLNNIPLESRPLESRPNGPSELGVVNESGADSASSAETASTAPASAPSTPSVIPARSSLGMPRNSSIALSSGDRGRRPIGACLRKSPSSTNYRRSFLTEKERKLEQSSLRIQVRDDLRNENVKYALKHLTNTLLQNPKDFYLAAAALVIEAKYLSKLSHPNIVRVCGLAAGKSQLKGGAAGRSSKHFGAGDQEGIESGQYDSYFLISERLTDTLDGRIRKWKREQPSHKKLSQQSSGERIRSWRLMMRKTSYALQISNALQYLHQRNLLYRDLKPQNIGFVGDNQTIAIFNCGLIRELNPATGQVSEDEITAMYGAQSWRYTAPECFSRPIHSVLSETLIHGTNFINSSNRSVELDFNANGNGAFSRYSWHSRPGKEKALSFRELQKDVQTIGEQDNSEKSRGSAASATTPQGNERKGFWDDAHVKPMYDTKVDVYSWAMVYYEMLTMNPPFAKMSQKEHCRNVCGRTMDGYEGGQRPGVYNYDLTPSMISLLQRAWDQNPSRRPAMESVGKNLQTILRELEEMIKTEQKEMALAISGPNEALLPPAGFDGNTIGKEGEKVSKQQRKRRSFTFFTNTKRSQIAEDRVPAATAEPNGNVSDSTAKSANDGRRAEDLSSNSEIDALALEYEAWIDEEAAESESEESDWEGSEGSSLISSDKQDGENSNHGNPERNHGISFKQDTKDDESEGDADENVDRADNAISEFQNRKNVAMSRRALSSGQSVSNRNGTLKRMKDKATSPSVKSLRFRRTPSDTAERRGTSRMSRRTIRLSRQSIWMMRHDIRIMVFVAAIILVIVLAGGASYYWYWRKQNTMFGVRLGELKLLNDSQIMERMHATIKTQCYRDLPPIKDPSLPLLFRGGALSHYDSGCMEHMEQGLREELKLKLNVTDVALGLHDQEASKSADVREQCGFLKIHHFDPPPPQRKRRKSKWQRKKKWKFFRDG